MSARIISLIEGAMGLGIIIIDLIAATTNALNGVLLAENDWKVCNFPDEYAQGILINLPGHGLVAYSDVCTHLSCAVLYQGERR